MSRRSNFDTGRAPSWRTGRVWTVRGRQWACRPTGRHTRSRAFRTVQPHARLRAAAHIPHVRGGSDPMPRLIADRPVLRMTSELGRVMAAARAREQAGERVMHLERGEPDFDTPPHIVEALAAAARAGETHYPDQRGTLALRQALVEKLARENGILCEPDDVVMANGGTHALFIAFQALMSPGDEVLVLSPHWMAIPKLVAFSAGAGYRTVPVYLDLLEGTLDPAGLAARLRAALTPSIRGLYLNTPNNPTGAVLTRAQLDAVAAVAIERDLWVISDEAYEHL